jgi:hypothetical protein
MGYGIDETSVQKAQPGRTESWICGGTIGSIPMNEKRIVPILFQPFSLD